MDSFSKKIESRSGKENFNIPAISEIKRLLILKRQREELTEQEYLNLSNFLKGLDEELAEIGVGVFCPFPEDILLFLSKPKGWNLFVPVFPQRYLASLEGPDGQQKLAEGGLSTGIGVQGACLLEIFTVIAKHFFEYFSKSISCPIHLCTLIEPKHYHYGSNSEETIRTTQLIVDKISEELKSIAVNCGVTGDYQIIYPNQNDKIRYCAESEQYKLLYNELEEIRNRYFEYFVKSLFAISHGCNFDVVSIATDLLFQFLQYYGIEVTPSGLVLPEDRKKLEEFRGIFVLYPISNLDPTQEKAAKLALCIAKIFFDNFLAKQLVLPNGEIPTLPYAIFTVNPLSILKSLPEEKIEMLRIWRNASYLEK